MLKREREEEVTTVGDLKAVLAECDDDTPIQDVFGGGILLNWVRDTATGDLFIEVT